MNILFISAVLPYPLYSGGQVRVYNLLKILSRTHKITLCAFIRNSDELAYLKYLSFCKKVLVVHRGRAWQARYIVATAFGSMPFLFQTYNNSSMRRCITDELRSDAYDLIHIEPGYVYPSLPPTKLPVVVGEHNIEHTIYDAYVKQFSFAPLRPLLGLDVAKLHRWEERVWQGARAIVTVSQEDKKVIEKAVPTATVSVVPNGVDTLTYTLGTRRDGLTMPIFLFVGSFAWIQNRDAVRYLVGGLWPILRKQYPTATLRIVGKQMPDDLVALCRVPGVVLLDGVSVIADELHNAHILLAPIRIGGGTKFKILEAMAAGLPVITTAIGASGLAVRDRQELLIAQEPSDWLRAVTILLTDETLALAIAQHGRRCVEQHYAWQQIARELERAWQQSL